MMAVIRDLESEKDYLQALDCLYITLGPLRLAERGVCEMSEAERVARRGAADDLEGAIAEYEQRNNTAFRVIDNRKIERIGGENVQHLKGD